MKFTITFAQQQFLELLRAGLWGKPADPTQAKEEIEQHAHFTGTSPSTDLIWNFIRNQQALQTESKED